MTIYKGSDEVSRLRTSSFVLFNHHHFQMIDTKRAFQNVTVLPDKCFWSDNSTSIVNHGDDGPVGEGNRWWLAITVRLLHTEGKEALSHESYDL